MLYFNKIHHQYYIFCLWAKKLISFVLLSDCKMYKKITPPKKSLTDFFNRICCKTYF